MRRRMMMQTEKSDAKHPLVNGRHEFSDGSYVEVTNGNHVKIVGNTSAGLNTIGTPDTTDDRIENIVLTQNKNVGALFCYSSVLGGAMEFDVSMEVNGERWI